VKSKIIHTDGFQFELFFLVDKCQTICSQIFFGGWKNTKSAIRLNSATPHKAELLTPYIVSKTKYHGFWIRWEDGLVEVGKEGEVTPFLKWKDPQPFDVRYYGISTGNGATGSWITEGE